MTFEKPDQNEWIKERTKFHEKRGLSPENALKLAGEESETPRKIFIMGMKRNPESGEMMREETMKEIEKEMEKRGTTKEKPSTDYH